MGDGENFPTVASRARYPLSESPDCVLNFTCNTCDHPEGIPVAPQLVEMVVYVDMKALEEEAAVNC